MACRRSSGRSPPEGMSNAVVAPRRAGSPRRTSRSLRSPGRPSWTTGTSAEAGTPSTTPTPIRLASPDDDITYRRRTARQKFGRSLNRASTAGFGVDFKIESYLDYQGQSFLERFDALSYLYLTRVMDYFDPFGTEDSLGRVQRSPVNFLVISFDSDWRFSTEHSQRIVRRLERGRIPVTFREISSPWGHDSFLLRIPAYHDTLRAFFDRAAEVECA